MAEGRMLRKKVSIDERVAQLSAHSALLYVLSIPHLDREGRMDGSPVAVRGTVIPYIAQQHADEWRDDLVAGYMTEWTQTADQDGHPDPLVLWYCVRGLWVCHFPGFAKNQKIRFDRESPSRFPAPPGDLLSQIVPRAAAAEDAAPRRDADPDPAGSDAVPGPVGERLFADHQLPHAVAADPTRNAVFESDPDLVRTQAEAEVQVQDPPEQRGPSRAREASSLAALPDQQIPEDPLQSIVAGVARRREALASHGDLARLLEVITDADDQTPAVLHALFDPLGERAIEHARAEILEHQPRSPARYAVGIAKRWPRQGAAA